MYSGDLLNRFWSRCFKSEVQTNEGVRFNNREVKRFDRVKIMPEGTQMSATLFSI